MICDDIKKRLGENVKRIRKEQRLTQFQLAEKAELSEETVKNIELSRCWTSDIHSLFLPVSTSFDSDSKDSVIIKNAIAENIKHYVDSVLKEITKNK